MPVYVLEGSLERRGRRGGSKGRREEGREGEIRERIKEKETRASAVIFLKKLLFPQPALSLGGWRKTVAVFLHQSEPQLPTCDVDVNRKRGNIYITTMATTASLSSFFPR